MSPPYRPRTSWGITALAAALTVSASALVPCGEPPVPRNNPYESPQYERPGYSLLRQHETAEERRRRLQQERTTGILSASKLNELLREIRSNSHALAAGNGTTPLDVKTVRRLNLTRGKEGACIALLRQADTLRWPRTLQQARFETERKQIDALLPRAAKQARAAKVQAKLVRDLDGKRKRLGRQLAEAVSDLSPNQYIDAMRFLNWLDAAVAALRDPDVRSHFTATDELPRKAKTVGALVRYLTDNGWQFAPALEHDRDAYLDLHQAMEAYARQVRSATGKK